MVAVSYTCPALIEEEHHREKTTEEHITPEFNATGLPSKSSKYRKIDLVKTSSKSETITDSLTH